MSGYLSRVRSTLIRMGCSAVVGWFVIHSGSVWAQTNWPEFLGPTGNGQALSTASPAVRFGEGDHVTFRTKIHGKGWSSPVIWGDQVWMGTADEDGRRYFGVCVHRETGEILHDLLLFEESEPKFCHDMNSYASPTPVIEAGFVYLHFGSYGTACVSTEDGRVVWSRRDLPCDHFRGPGSSPTLWKDLLILHYDGFDFQYAIALDKRTGETVWKRDRDIDYGTDNGDVMKAYSTPIVVEIDGRPVLLSSTSKACLALDPSDGSELWRIRYDGFSATARPIYHDGLVYVNSGFSTAELIAVKPEGMGDLTDSQIVWRTGRGIGSKPSHVIVDDALYTIHDQGVLTALDAKTGKELWRERLEGDLFSASLIHAGGHLYVCSHDGRVSAVRPNREAAEVVAVNTLESGIMATPAISGNSLFIRTKTHLYRID